MALQIYGIFSLFVWCSSIPGGIIADRYLGQRKSVYIGAFIITAAHYIMYIPPDWCFFTGLALIAIGVGFLKPNISIMVG